MGHPEDEKVLQHHKDKSNKLTSNVGLVAKVQQCPLIVYEQFRAAKCKVALKKDLYSRTKKKKNLLSSLRFII